jgi:hypothetical protein
MEVQSRLRSDSLSSFVLVLAMVAIAPNMSLATVTLENAHVALIFDGNYSLSRMTEKNAGFDLAEASSGSPIWNLTLLHANPGSPLHWINDFTRLNAVDPGVAAMASHTLVNLTAGQQLEITWAGVPIVGTDLSNSFQLVLGVFLPNDSAEAQWSLDVQLSGTGYRLWRATAPILLFPESGTGLPTLDRAALPRKAGALIHDPAQKTLLPLNQDETQGDSPVGSHPRDYELQYMQLYEAETGNGFFLRTTDSEGTLKGLILHRTAAGHLLIMARHYPEEVTLTGLSYSLPYQVRTQPFVGDWYDGARFYRDFFLTLPAAAKGSIETRSDIAQSDIESLHMTLIADVNGTGNYPNTLNLEASLQTWRDFFEPVKTIVHLRGMGPSTPLPNLLSAAGAAALGIASDLGVRTLPYTNSYAWLKSSADDANDTRANASSKTFDGVPAESGLFNEIRMDPYVSDWRDLFLLRGEALLNAGATDLYIDLNPNFHFCFDSSHGHPLGSGRHFMQGYRAEMLATRIAGKNRSANFAMLPEHRSELTVDLFDFYRIPYWTGDGASPFVGGIEGALPVPLIAVVMHDYIGLAASTGLEATYETLGAEAYRFAHAYSFVQGNNLSMADLGHDLLNVSAQKLAAFDFVRALLFQRMIATKSLLYGEMLRPPETGSAARSVTFSGVAYIQPAILSSAFGASDGSLTFTMVNDGSGSETGDFTLRLSDYTEQGLDQGTWELHSIESDLQAGNLVASPTFYGGFREVDYTRRWRFETRSVLMLEARLTTDIDVDGMGDTWESLHGLDPNDPTDAQSDLDGDSLSNLQEFRHGTDPNLSDTDSDGVSDALEIGLGSDPRNAGSGSSGPPQVPLLTEWLILGLTSLLSAVAISRTTAGRG